MSPFLRALSAAAVATLVTLTPSALAQINVGSDGSDGVFNPSNNVVTTIDLNLAPVGNWDDPSPIPGRGIYDPNLWAVVFKYESINIPINSTIRFTNRVHGNPPVIWLVRTNATITGTVVLDGQNSGYPNIAAGGPGGFAGGVYPSFSGLPSAGFGPGGGTLLPATNRGAAGASFGTMALSVAPYSPVLPPYSNPTLMPLIGGSGGSPVGWIDAYNASGAGGGGAIMVAVGNTLRVPGRIQSNGGSGAGATTGGGSGGGVRLIADVLAGETDIIANGGSSQNTGGYGGTGRIRIEANDLSTAVLTVTPAPSIGPVSPLFPTSSTPKVQIASVEGLAAPADPRSDINVADIALTPIGNVDIDINAFNIPATWVVQVQVKPRNGTDIYFNASRISGNDTSSLYRASIPQFPIGLVSLQVRAYLP